MAKLPKSIIKKHGITKKAWRIFKSGKNKGRAKKKTKIRSVRKVAKKKRKSKQASFKMPMGLMSILAPVGYGFVRERVSDALSNTELVQRLPVTEFTDEAVMLAVNFGLRKAGLGKVPIVSSVLRAQKTIEWNRIGETLGDTQIKKVGGKSQIFIM